MDSKKGKVIVKGLREKNLPGDHIVVNCTSKSKEEWSRMFSPFHLGPVEVFPFEDTRYTSQNMENAW